jgi:hypothetical protein
MSIEIEVSIGYIERDPDGHVRTIVLHPTKPTPPGMNFHAAKTARLTIAEGSHPKEQR